MSSIIHIKNATVFRGANKVFDRLNLDFKLGEHTAILGPNGAGKTTLLKLLTREVSPVVKEGSSIQLFGESKTNIWELRQKIGVVSHEFQNEYRAIATGEDVVISAFFGSVGLHGHNTVTEHHRLEAQKILSSLDLMELRHRQYLQLSTGQQRRLLLARALVHQPQVLIFDEPTNGLDLKSGFRLIEDMRQLSRQGKTLILVTHHTQELIPEIQRVVMIKSGNIFRDGDKQTTMTDDNISQLYETPIHLQHQKGFYHAIPK